MNYLSVVSSTKILNIISMMIFLLLIPAAHAEDCYSTITSYPSFKINGTVSVPKDAPTGTILTPVMTTYVGERYTNDNISGGLREPIYWLYRFSAQYTGIRSNNAVVYKTNIDGIGIAYKNFDDSSFNDPGTISTGSHSSGGALRFKLDYWLVKIGDVTAGGLLKSDDFMHMYYRCGTYSYDRYIGLASSLPGDATVVITSCQTLDTDIEVPMGSLKRADFKSVGTVAGLNNFKIPLSCDAGANVSFTLSPSANGSSDANKGILNLNNPADSATAKGIGLQILFKNAPLKLNEATVAGTASSQNFDIPLQAQYIQTQNTVTAGTADASATFIISYH